MQQKYPIQETRRNKFNRALAETVSTNSSKKCMEADEALWEPEKQNHVDYLQRLGGAALLAC